MIADARQHPDRYFTGDVLSAITVATAAFRTKGKTKKGKAADGKGKACGTKTGAPKCKFSKSKGIVE